MLDTGAGSIDGWYLGGVKFGGIERERGPVGVRDYLQPKTVAIRR